MEKRSRFEAASRACLDNARDCLVEAKLLFDNRHFARAFAISVLGLEEITKAEVCRGLGTGAISSENEIVKGKAGRDGHKGMRDHGLKQARQSWNLLFGELIGGPLLKIVEELEHMDLSTVEAEDRAADVIEQRLKAYDQYLEDLGTKGTRERRQLKAQANVFNNLEEKREAAFYVEVDYETGNIDGKPSDTSEQQTKLVIYLLERALKLQLA